MRGDASRCRDESCASASASHCSCKISVSYEMFLIPRCSTGTRAVSHRHRCRAAYGVGIFSWGQSYRMVLSVRRRIHWGIGRFCFFALASFCFVRKDLWLC